MRSRGWDLDGLDTGYEVLVPGCAGCGVREHEVQMIPGDRQEQIEIQKSLFKILLICKGNF